MSQNVSAGKACILVVDDDGLILAMLSQGLRERGYRVLEAESGEEAVAVCKKEKPDLAILDNRMPGMSGIEAAREIFSTTQVPFMFLSAFDDSEIVKNAISEGALGYLVKPINVRQIIPSIEAALSRAHEIKALKKNEANLSAALSVGRETSIVIGMIMDHLLLGAGEAEDLFRSYARSERRKMTEIASEIVKAAEAVNAFLKSIENVSKKDMNK